MNVQGLTFLSIGRSVCLLSILIGSGVQLMLFSRYFIIPVLPQINRFFFNPANLLLEI